MTMGRPSIKTPELVDEIVERLSKGEPLAKICESDHMPSYSTVWNWEKDDPDFLNASMRAREHGTNFIADDCIRIADDPDIEPADKRVRIDTRLRLIGKWNVKRYGDAMLHKHADADGEKIKLDEVGRAARLAALASEINAANGQSGDAGD